MRIFLLTMDSSCFSKKGEDYPEVAKLKSWQINSWVDLTKSGVLEKESEGLSGHNLQTLKEKTKDISVDYGIVLHGFPGGALGAEHILGEYIWWYGSARSKFEEIYEVLFGERWQKGRQAAGKVRDALHLDTHQINDRDYFVTKDKHHILMRASELERHFGIKVRSLKDCVKEIENYWKQDGTFPPEILTSPRIIAGTCIFGQFVLRKPGGSLIFGALKSENDFFLLKGTLYSPSGKELVQFSEQPIISDPGASLHADPSQTSNRNRIVMEGKTYAFVRADCDKTKIFEARILAGGHLLLWGEFFDEKGEKVACVNKEGLCLPGSICL